MSRPGSELSHEILERLPAGLILFRSVRDPGGAIVDFEWLFTNRAAAQLLGRSDAELRGKLLLEELPRHRGCDAFDGFVRVVETGEPSEQRVYYAADGLDASVSGRVIKVGDGFSVMFADEGIDDVSARRAAEEALRAADRQKDEFLAMLGHELRNPLAAIRSACSLLDGVELYDPLLSRVRAILARQTGHMAHLLDELLDLARVTSGKLSIVPSTIDLCEVAREVLADLGIASAGPRLSVELPEHPVWVEGDRVRLAQVIHSLLSNAIKYTPATGSVGLRLGHGAHEQAVLTVTDTGVGLDPELREHLFEPFQQAPQDIARSAGGLGLGLSLAKAIVDLHRGSIHARSPGPNLGSEFEVCIPLTTAEHPTVSESNEPTARTARVMIVEDNEDAAELLAALLRARGFDVELASRGEQAIAMVREWLPDAVICDIGLPDIDGYTVARTIRADPKLAEVKLVALSGYGQAKDRVRAAEAGFDQHLTKPAAIDAVVRAING